jgi:hypothetical protein
MDTSWSEQLEKFMLDPKEQGKTPITSSERFTRQVFHFSYFQNKQHDLINRVERTHSLVGVQKLNQTVVVQSSNNDSFFERSPSMTDDPCSNSFLVLRESIMHKKERPSPTIIEVDEDDEAFCQRRNVYTIRAGPIDEEQDKADISDFGAPLSLNLDERL